jgi:hypothetical protein
MRIAGGSGGGCLSLSSFTRSLRPSIGVYRRERFEFTLELRRGPDRLLRSLSRPRSENIPAMNEHPITLHVMDDLRRSRLTVFFRPLLSIPHFIWLALWGVVAGIVLILNWFVALIIGRPAKPFQRFIAAYLRYAITVGAYFLYIANPFPGFTGEPGSYPVELELPLEPEMQSRLKTFFRIVLVYPALFIAEISIYPVLLLFFPIIGLAWWATMITGRIPRGFRDLGANALRYLGQVYAYYYLVTGTYPCSSPYVGMALGSPVIADAPAALETPAAAAEAPEAPSEK